MGFGGGGVGVVSSVLGVCLRKSVTGVFPRSIPITSQRPPFELCSSWCRRRKVSLWRLVLSLAVCLHPPRMWVLFMGDFHFEHVGVGPCFLLYMCT